MARQARSRSRRSPAGGRRVGRRGDSGAPWWAALAGAAALTAFVVGVLAYIGAGLGAHVTQRLSAMPVASEAADAGRSLDVVIDSAVPVRWPNPPAAIPVRPRPAAMPAEPDEPEESDAPAAAPPPAAADPDARPAIPAPPVAAAPPPPAPVPAARPARAAAPASPAEHPNGDRELVAALSPPSLPQTGQRPAWLRNAVISPPPAGRPMVAVVIDDLGIDRAAVRRVIALRAPLTLAFMTYAEDLPRQTAAARAAGHELLVHVPMEPVGHDDPGPQALLTGLSPDEIRRRLAWGLGRFEGYVGINNHMGSRFTGARPGMEIVLGELQRRGLMFLDSRTTGSSAAPAIAHDLRLPFAERNVFLDNEQTPESVAHALELLEQTARRQGRAVAIGHPHPATIDALERWLPTVASRGLVLVPVTAIVRARMAG